MTGLLQKAKDAMKKRKFDRRVNKMFDTPQGGYNRRAGKDRRGSDMPTFKP